MISNPDSGIVTRKSLHSVSETARKVEEILKTKGIKLFAIVDHSGEIRVENVVEPPTSGWVLFGRIRRPIERCNGTCTGPLLIS